jgi:hypothetical protein
MVRKRVRIRIKLKMRVRITLLVQQTCPKLMNNG